MLIEICAPTYQSAINALAGGAHRIELCEHLATGGLTPNRELIMRVISEVTIPVFVLIRPRAGDFVYSEKEFNQMLEDIDFCKSIGCQGIVSGILNPDTSIDLARTKKLILKSKPLPFTFHRAFDATTDSHQSLNNLIQLGVNRVLTSGQAITALQGLNTLNTLKEIANGRLTILVGGKVRSTNIVRLKDAGFKEAHSSALINTDHSDIDEIQRIVELAED